MNARLTVAVWSLGLLLVPPAGAQLAAWDAEPGSVYLGIGGNGGHLELPEAKSFLKIGPSSTTRSSVDGRDSGWGGGAEGGVGYVLPADMSVLGSGLRIELAGRYFTMSEESSSGSTSILNYSWASADGNRALTNWTAAGPTMWATGLDYDEWGVDLLARTDFGDDGSVRISPFVGFTYTGSDRRDRFEFSDPGRSRTINASDDLETTYLGGTLGTRVALALGAGVVLSVEGRADLMGADADLDARDALTQSTGAPQTSSASQNGSSFAARLGGRVGISRRFGPVVIGIHGFGNWLSWSPQPVWPADTLPPTGTPPSGIPGLRLGSSDAWTAGGGVGVTVPF